VVQDHITKNIKARVWLRTLEWGSQENMFESGVEFLNKEIGRAIYLILVVEVA
jgi:hypothetical protein